MWDINDANVVCRQLGFVSAIAVYSKSHFGQVNSSFSIINLNCSGKETQIQECPHNTQTSANCGVNDGAGVECKVPGKVFFLN